METDRTDFFVASIGFLFVAAILYEAFSVPMALPSGYLAAAKVTSCCDDCSCTDDDICLACGGCAWTDVCASPAEGITPGGLYLTHSGRVEDGSTFVVNAVVYPKTDGKLLLELELPRGFEADRDSALVDAYAGERTTASFKVTVKENVAEMGHTFRVDMLDQELRTISSAEGIVDVYWAR